MKECWLRLLRPARDEQVIKAAKPMQYFLSQNFCQENGGKATAVCCLSKKENRLCKEVLAHMSIENNEIAQKLTDSAFSIGRKFCKRKKESYLDKQINSGKVLTVIKSRKFISKLLVLNLERLLSAVKRTDSRLLVTLLTCGVVFLRHLPVIMV